MLMKRLLLVALLSQPFLIPEAIAQNVFRFRHIIRKSAVLYTEKQEQKQTTSIDNNKEHNKTQTGQFPQQSGYALPLVLRKVGDKKLTEYPFSFCHDKLYAIVKFDKGIGIVDFWTILDTPDPERPPCIGPETKLIQKNDKDEMEEYRFELDLGRAKMGDVTKTFSIPFRGLMFGVSTIPLRYRFRYEGIDHPFTNPSNGKIEQRPDTIVATFASQLSLTFTAGYTVFGRSTINHRGITNWGITVGPFVGASSFEHKVSQYIDPNMHKKYGDRTIPTMSYGIQSTFSRNNFGVILSLGFDHAFGDTADQWVYQNKPWIGLGINSSLGYF